MSSTIVCILLTALLGVIFKIAGIRKLRFRYIITVNYLCCFLVGLVQLGPELFQNEYESWFYYALALGVLFAGGFNLFAHSIKLAGLPMATLFQKMSITLSVICAVILGDQFGLVQFTGIVLGLSAMYLVFAHNDSKLHINATILKVLMASLIVSALIEIVFILVNKTSHTSSSFDLAFPSYIFFIAFIAAFGQLFSHRDPKKFFPDIEEIGFGALLGLLNFYSIYYMVDALANEFQAAVFFPILNISIVVSACILGAYFFKEKLNTKQLIGILCSILSLLLLSR